MQLQLHPLIPMQIFHMVSHFLCALRGWINLQYFKSRFWENPNLEDAPFSGFFVVLVLFYFLELYSEV